VDLVPREDVHHSQAKLRRGTRMTADHVLAGYLTKAELARQLDRNERTLELWARQQIGPPITRIGKEPYYFVDSVRAWLRAKEEPMPRAGRCNTTTA
jgi:hypothetical protein